MASEKAAAAHVVVGAVCPDCGWAVRDGACCGPCGSARAVESAARRRLREAHAAALGGARALEQFTFERFARTKANDAALKASSAFTTLANLYLFGPTGCGKSHLAAAAARKYLDGPGVVTLKAPKLAREVRAAQDADGEERVIRRYVVAPVLVLDDLGVAKDTEFSTTVLYELIDGRYSAEAGGLIVTSNLGLGALAEKLGDDRISSRLVEMCRASPGGAVVGMVGEKDWRVRPGASAGATGGGS